MIILLVLLFCCCSSSIVLPIIVLGGFVELPADFLSFFGLTPLALGPTPGSGSGPGSGPGPGPDLSPQEQGLKDGQEKATDEFQEALKNSSETGAKLALARATLSRAKTVASNATKTFNDVNKVSEELTEARVLLKNYQEAEAEATIPEERLIWEEIVVNAQARVDEVNEEYLRVRAEADKTIAALREQELAEAAALKLDTELADANRLAGIAAAAEAQEFNRLETLRKGCLRTSWENVYVGGRPGMADGPKFWNSTSVKTFGQTITEGMLRIVVARDNSQTTISSNMQTGRNSRGQPTYGWGVKKQFAGFIVVSGSSVGWFSMKKKPNNKQPNSCKSYRPNKTNCQYSTDEYNELYNFADDTKKYKLTFKDSRFGLLQGQTGKFYDIANDEVIDNPHKSDCQKDLNYK